MLLKPLASGQGGSSRRRRRLRHHSSTACPLASRPLTRTTGRWSSRSTLETTNSSSSPNSTDVVIHARGLVLLGVR